MEKPDEVYLNFFKLTKRDVEKMDELIERRLSKFTFPGCHRASLEHFMETGKASGSLRTELHALLVEFKNLDLETIKQ